MKDLLLKLPKNKSPIYKRLADAIRALIREGKIRPGESLPSSRSLATRFRINRHTVMNGVAELIAEGWIESHARSKYRVTTTLPTMFLQSKDTLIPPYISESIAPHFSRTVEISDRYSAPRAKHQFPSGFPDVRLFPRKALNSHLYDALQSSGNLTYSDPRGQDRLISQITTYLRRMRNIAGRDILISNGSQEAIFLLAQLLISPGDHVAVESLSYPPAVAALKFAGAHLHRIPLDGEGLDVEYLTRLIKKHPLRLLYITPLHQYPTTVTLSASRRLQLYELACKTGLLILEDDYDHEFHYDSQPTAPLASFDPANLVLYVSTFSKILFPSARIGFMAVPHHFTKELAKLKRISSRQNESILQDAVGRWMESGGFEQHLRRMRRAYELRRDEMVTSLTAIKSWHPAISWDTPGGGMALWLNTGSDSDKLAAKALTRGVSVTPESTYRLDGQSGTHLRLGFSGQTPEENNKALNLLFPRP
jgi:GntR family transcriptional regulator / MocR family aminotransferase